MGLRLRLLPLFKRARELLVEQGHVEPLTEDDASDFLARGRSNYADDMRIVVQSPTEVYAACAQGHTSCLRILPDEGPEEVRVLGEICKASLRMALKDQRAKAQQDRG